MLQNQNNFEMFDHKFELEIAPDNDAEPTWAQDSSVLGWVPFSKRSKKPGQRHLKAVDGMFVYDWQGAIAKAKAEVWGLGTEDLANLEHKLGRKPTSNQIAEAAVQQDFDRIQRWLDVDWYYVGVIVTLWTDSELPFQASLWGIESDCKDYIEEVIKDLALEAVHESKTALSSKGII